MAFNPFTEPNHICSAFNGHFAAAGFLYENTAPATDSQEHDNTFPATSIDPAASCASLLPPDLPKVYNALRSIDLRTATGDDKLDRFFLKTSATVISPTSSISP
ncbi:unnamed protein product [Arctogadus glacialis]